MEGEFGAWSAVSLAGGPVQDHRWESSNPDELDFVDFDFDGAPDLIAYGHDHGLRGLTLTNDSLPVLSKLVPGEYDVKTSQPRAKKKKKRKKRPA